MVNEITLIDVLGMETHEVVDAVQLKLGSNKSAQNSIVNVELFKGGPITVGITKTGAADFTKEVNTGESIKESINTKEGIDYTKYIRLLYRFEEDMAEDVARFLERGKLAPEQYVGITGEGYEASVVDQQVVG
ncbi:hypothetical protein [Brevibacillus sp. AF8]|uniref:hypothetical protein n=1 Tax=Brevibacillus sp. AF8 TaxID=2825881 RepID=UPI001E32D3B2|nr:hypothetical protein [Brevibacillus sp. AF8]